LTERAILLIVPGKNDRAFYKAFIAKAFRNKPNIRVNDLDSEEKESRKEYILRKILPVSENSNLIKGTASLEIISEDNNKTVYIIIIPSEIQVIKKTIHFLNHFLGLEDYKSIVDTIIVIDDAEDKSFEERLNSFYDSVASRIDLGDIIKGGVYFRCYSLKKPDGLKLLFVVQGLKDINVVEKHALEDFIIYVFSNELGRGPLKPCIDVIKSLKNKNSHKKLALLIVLSKCYTSLDKFFFKSLSKQEIEDLKEIHDGLNEIINVVQECLTS